MTVKKTVFIFIFPLVVCFQFPVNKAQAIQVQFDNEANSQSNSGFIKLVWITPSSADSNPLNFEVQQGSSKDFTSAFRIIYHGPDRATFISGLENGTYFYRVRSLDHGESGPWSDTIQLDVQHHSLSLAYLLFGLGGFVFLMTVGLVALGMRNNQKPQLT